MRSFKSRVTAELFLGAIGFCSFTAPVIAQDYPVGQVARSAAGQVGQRQTRAQTLPSTAPTGRISNRINNRVQSRVRTRIDHDYVSQVNFVSPFAIAGDQARLPGQAPRR